MTNRRATIISLAVRNHLPTVFENPVFARDGGLVSYSADFEDNFRRSAQYVNNIRAARSHRSFLCKCR